MKILVFDTETSGLPEHNASIQENERWPYILQISYILYDLSTNNAIIKDNFIKVADSVVITEESFNIHHISRDHLNNFGVHIIPALREFNEFVRISDVIIGHNVSFDKRMVFVECLRNNIKQNFTVFRGKNKIQKPEYCTMKNSKEFCNIIRLNKTGREFVKNPSLTELYQKLFPDAIQPENLHNSMVDTLITLRCYMKLNYDLDIADVNEVCRDILIKYNILVF